MYPNFWSSVKQAMNEKIHKCVAALAAVSLITGEIYDPKSGWKEGVAILCALMILILISSWNDWMKDRLFAKLNTQCRDEEVTVVRGKLGAMQKINIWKLVVGDVVILNTGDKVPADCIIINSTNLVVQEEDQEYKTKKDVKKDAEQSPFLYADSYILNGHVRAVVAVVGRESTRIKEEKLDLDENTPLQDKLYNLTSTFTCIGLWAALLIFIVAIASLSIYVGTTPSTGADYFSKVLVEDLILPFIIVLVALPEGLPMTVGISIAYSLDNMYKKDKILVRDLTSNEKMGQVTDFILGKTGTLTT